MDEHVDSLRNFLTRWRSQGLVEDEDQQLCGPAVAGSLVGPEWAPALPLAPKRIFRPHEILPALYLGGITDVTDVSGMAHGIKEETSRRCGGSSKTAAAAPAEGQRRALPHHLYLLLCACADTSTPAQLELLTFHYPSAKHSGPIRSKHVSIHPCEVVDTLPLSQLRSELLAHARRLDPRQYSSVLSETSLPPSLVFDYLQTRLTKVKTAAESDREGSPSRRCASGPKGFFWKLSLPLLDEPEESIHPFFVLSTHILLAVNSAAPQTLDQVETRSAGELSKPCAVVHCVAGKSRSATLVIVYALHMWARQNLYPKVHYARRTVRLSSLSSNGSSSTTTSSSLPPLKLVPPPPRPQSGASTGASRRTNFVPTSAFISPRAVDVAVFPGKHSPAHAPLDGESSHGSSRSTTPDLLQRGPLGSEVAAPSRMSTRVGQQQQLDTTNLRPIARRMVDIATGFVRDVRMCVCPNTGFHDQLVEEVHQLLRKHVGYLNGERPTTARPTTARRPQTAQQSNWIPRPPEDLPELSRPASRAMTNAEVESGTRRQSMDNQSILQNAFKRFSIASPTTDEDNNNGGIGLPPPAPRSQTPAEQTPDGASNEMILNSDFAAFSITSPVTPSTPETGMGETRVDELVPI